MEIRLVEIDSSNWRQVVEVRPRPDQEVWVAPVSRYLCLCHYGGVWRPLGIEVDGELVGHLMWAVDPDDGSTWLGGFIVDADRQGEGIGRAAVLAFLDRFTADGATNAALSYSPDNRVARDLYLDIGFVETGEMAEDEVVARLVRPA